MFRIYQVKQTVCQLYLQTAQFQCKTIAAYSSFGILESGFLYQTCYLSPFLHSIMTALMVGLQFYIDKWFLFSNVVGLFSTGWPSCSCPDGGGTGQDCGTRVTKARGCGRTGPPTTPATCEFFSGGGGRMSHSCEYTFLWTNQWHLINNYFWRPLITICLKTL